MEFPKHSSTITHQPFTNSTATPTTTTTTMQSTNYKPINFSINALMKEWNEWKESMNEGAKDMNERNECMHAWISKWIIDTTTFVSCCCVPMWVLNSLLSLSWGCRVSTSSQLGWSAGCCKSCRSKTLLVLHTFGIPMCSIFLDNLNLQVNLWLQIYLVFSPRSLGKWSNLTNFILFGLKSHHLQKALQ